MKSILILILISFLLAGCRKISDPVSVNRYDPESEYFTGNPAKGLNVKTLSRSSVKLIWRDSSSFETGYKIERTALNSGKIDTFMLNKDVNSFIAENLDISETYKFRIGATLDRPYFSYTDSVTIKYNPYPEMVTSPISGPVQLSDNSERCISFTSPSQDSEPDQINIYNIHGNDFSLLRTKSFFRKGTANYFLSGDGRFIAFSRYDIYGYYDIDNDKMVSFQDLNVRKIAISPDSRNIIIDHSDSLLIIWNIAANTRKSLNVYKYFTSGFSSIQMSPDNHYAACSDWDKITIFDLESMSLCYSAGIPTNGEVMGFSDNSEVFFFHCYNYSFAQPLYFYNLKNKKIFYTKTPGYYQYMKYIRNSEFILCYSGGKVYFWKLEDDIPKIEIPVYFPKEIDGRLLGISASSDGSFMPVSYQYTDFLPTYFLRFKENWRTVK
ncbi:MAG TPA: hypothetical protein VHO03_10330 [Ignavibacteriales bacterium]|nr:hypothetical protein [Ignavibacteriales bacterium]